jgi:hypothetical protein
MLGIPHLSLLIVNEKQQLTNPSSVSTTSLFPPLLLARERPAGVPVTAAEDEVAVVPAVDGFSAGLYRSTQEVRTAFCDRSNATLPYFFC